LEFDAFEFNIKGIIFQTTHHNISALLVCRHNVGGLEQHEVQHPCVRLGIDAAIIDVLWVTE